jgi:hypothetical protein
MSSGALPNLQPFAKTHESCCICLEPISERAVTNCDHWFDFLCLASWLQEHTTCPLCKAHVTKLEYDWRSPENYLTYIPSQEVKTATATPASWTSSSNRPGRSPYTQVPRRPRPARRPVTTISPDAAILRRRYLYRHQLFCLHVGSNRLSKFKDFTTKDFSESLELQARARKWIRRELQVFDFLSVDAPASSSGNLRRAENAEFLLLYVISILKTVDIKGSSGKAEELVGSYLGAENAKLFLHELEAWLRSPYINLEDFDRVVQYRIPLPSFAEQGKHSKKSQAEAPGRRGFIEQSTPRTGGIMTTLRGYIPD